MNIGASLNVTHYPFGHVICEDVGMTMGCAFDELRRQQAASGVNGGRRGRSALLMKPCPAQSLVLKTALSAISHQAVPIPERVEGHAQRRPQSILRRLCAGRACCTIHVDILKGTDPHHIWGKRLPVPSAKALNRAFALNPWRKGDDSRRKGYLKQTFQRESPGVKAF